MNFNDYQKTAVSTAIYPNKYSIIYPALGLGGESGEVLEKVKKMIRDSDGMFTDESKLAIKKELGDVLWYVANLANDLNLELDDIANTNLEKLLSRKERGVLGGSGDNR
jgi:NTP pyrophosphatase (non-canonical NTP hydrolase)